MTDRKATQSDSDVAKAGRKSKPEPQAAEIDSSGDNRRLGDVDGNRNAGDARSPGADNPE